MILSSCKSPISIENHISKLFVNICSFGKNPDESIVSIRSKEMEEIKLKNL